MYFWNVINTVQNSFWSLSNNPTACDQFAHGCESKMLREISDKKSSGACTDNGLMEQACSHSETAALWCEIGIM